SEARQPHATKSLCQDLLDLLYNSSTFETVYGKVPLSAKLLVK
ncbi:diglucosyl diacylglycerol synthase, partial [Staphylococcus pseudintermedius]